MKFTVLFMLAAIIYGAEDDLKKSGTYTIEGDIYTLVIHAGGTRSEKRTGTLIRDSIEITGNKIGEVVETKFGKMCWLGPINGERHSRGWLRYATYGDPVFNDDGTVVKKFIQ